MSAPAPETALQKVENIAQEALPYVAPILTDRALSGMGSMASMGMSALTRGSSSTSGFRGTTTPREGMQEAKFTNPAIMQAARMGKIVNPGLSTTPRGLATGVSRVPTRLNRLPLNTNSGLKRLSQNGKLNTGVKKLSTGKSGTIKKNSLLSNVSKGLSSLGNKLKSTKSTLTGKGSSTGKGTAGLSNKRTVNNNGSTLKNNGSTGSGKGNTPKPSSKQVAPAPKKPTVKAVQPTAPAPAPAKKKSG